MSLLVRKISRGKWPESDYLSFSVSNLRADAITSCLRTSSDTLSTWEVESFSQLKEAVLALATNSASLESIDVIWIEKYDLMKQGFQIDGKEHGNTSVEDLKQTHRNVTGLTYQTIGDFANVVLMCLHHSRYIRFKRAKVKEILVEALRDGRLPLSSLKEGLREDLKEQGT